MGNGFGTKKTNNPLKDIRDQKTAKAHQKLSKNTFHSANEMKMLALQHIPSDLFADFLRWNMEMQGHDYSAEQINYEAYKTLNSDPQRLSQWLNTGLFYAFAHDGVKQFCSRTAEVLVTYSTADKVYSEATLFDALLKGVTMLEHDCWRSFEDSNDEHDENYIDDRFKDVDKNVYENILAEESDEFRAYAIAWLVKQKRDSCNLFVKDNPEIYPQNKQICKNNFSKLVDRIPDHSIGEFLVQFYDWIESKSDLFAA